MSGIGNLTLTKNKRLKQENEKMKAKIMPDGEIKE